MVDGAGRLLVLMVMLAGVAVGMAAGVTVESHPQRIDLGVQQLPNDDVLVDSHEANYTGAEVAGFNVTVTNEASVDLNTEITVRIKYLNGTVIDSASESDTVLATNTKTFEVTFGTTYAHDSFGRVAVNVSTSSI